MIFLLYTYSSYYLITSFQAQMFHSAQLSTSGLHSRPACQIHSFNIYRIIESIDIAPPVEIDPTIW